MSLVDTIASIGGQSAIEQVAKQFGLPASVTSQAVGMMLPSLSAGASRNIQSEDGLGALINALSSGGHATYLEEPATLATPEAALDGNAILGHLLGGKDASRGVAATVAGALGIDNAIVKKMLPIVATMAMGALAKQGSSANISDASSKSSTGDLLGQITGMLGSGGASEILGQLFK